ncbi:hypothetical protein BDR03DRAFT_941556, partial [Suillus americanus]
MSYLRSHKATIPHGPELLEQRCRSRTGLLRRRVRGDRLHFCGSEKGTQQTWLFSVSGRSPIKLPESCIFPLLISYLGISSRWLP